RPSPRTAQARDQFFRLHHEEEQEAPEHQPRPDPQRHRFGAEQGLQQGRVSGLEAWLTAANRARRNPFTGRWVRAQSWRKAAALQPGAFLRHPRSGGTAGGPPLLARHVLEAAGGTDVLKPLPLGGFLALLVVPSEAFSTGREKQEFVG